MKFVEGLWFEQGFMKWRYYVIANIYCTCHVIKKSTTYHYKFDMEKKQIYSCNKILELATKNLAKK